MLKEQECGKKLNTMKPIETKRKIKFITNTVDLKKLDDIYIAYHNLLNKIKN
jgi:hypothetical protein